MRTPTTRNDAQRWGFLAWLDNEAGGYRFAWADSEPGVARGKGFNAARQAELAFRARRPRRIPVAVGRYPKQAAPKVRGAIVAAALAEIDG